VIALADTLAADVQTTMAALNRAGVRQTVMLTGDNARRGGGDCQAGGLTDFRAELMPEDKVTPIQALGQQFGVVAMVGDGVNDAPALANATVALPWRRGHGRGARNSRCGADG